MVEPVSSKSTILQVRLSKLRVLDGRSNVIQGSNVSSGVKLRLWPYCADAQNNLNLRCAQMPSSI